MPIPALAEVQVALQEAVARVTGDRGEALKRRLRTGTVVTNDDRNWELRWTQERRRINLSRAVAVDMESATVATQGFRMRVPYGTLLCVSDKPLHGEIKLPGAANAFYERAIGEHLQIGIAALELLQTSRSSLHSRKLRSFDEPPFRGKSFALSGEEPAPGRRPGGGGERPPDEGRADRRASIPLEGAPDPHPLPPLQVLPTGVKVDGCSETWWTDLRMFSRRSTCERTCRR